MSSRPHRVRFAPSPTGSLHLGNARTALFNWLLARQSGGSLILRIEDTDIEREQAGAEAAILEDLRWLGLDWEEGPDVGGAHGPYRQSERREIYLARSDELLRSGQAYRCFCSEEQLRADAALRGAGGERPGYPGRCRGLTVDEVESRVAAGEAHAIRFAASAGADTDPQAAVGFVDRLRGAIAFPVRELGDTVIVRRDGRPTYNFAVVVDDLAMEVDLVVRGDDHLSNTPRQVLMFEALGGPVPEFAHLPMVGGADGRRLSKRHGAESVESYRRQGYPAEGLVNALALLGWSPGADRVLVDRPELLERFDLDRVNRAPAAFDVDKLDWVCNQHIQKWTVGELARRVGEQLASAGLLPAEADPAWLETLTELIRPGLSHLAAVPERCRPLFAPGGDPGTEEARAVLAAEGAAEVVAALARVAREDPPVDTEAWKRLKASLVERTGVRGKQLFRPLRVTITGAPAGPELDRLIGLIESGSRLFPERIPTVVERAERTLQWLE